MPSFSSKVVDILAGRRIVLLNSKDSQRLDIRSHDRVKVRSDARSVTARIELTSTIVSEGELGLPKDVAADLEISTGQPVSISLVSPPESVNFIRKKMKGERLSADEIFSIVQDTVNHELGDIEMMAFLLAEEFCGMSDDEIVYLTKAMTDTGEKIDFGGSVYDKHSVGGVPGNKVSLIIVPIIAAAGLLIPKTSSRAITSPSGTADTMSVLAPVEFSAAELKMIVSKVNGAIAWGGGLNIAPADDIFIHVEHSLQIDPEPQMIASIMAKKLAVGTDYMVLDLPVGKEAKIETVDQARKLSARFIQIGERVGIRVKCAITFGGQPVGHAVGPALEAKEALEALEGSGPGSLVEKSTALAGLLLELAGKAVRGQGQELAKYILSSGRALKMMKSIIEAQGGDPNVKSSDVQLGSHRIALTAPCDGYVTRVSNYATNQIARAAGAPQEKGAGVLFYCKEGYSVAKGKKILEIFAERESKLNEAYSLALKLNPISIEGMLIQEIPEY
jgi:AMP phosphorylase